MNLKQKQICLSLALAAVCSQAGYTQESKTSQPAGQPAATDTSKGSKTVVTGRPRLAPRPFRDALRKKIMAKKKKATAPAAAAPAATPAAGTAGSAK